MEKPTMQDIIEVYKQSAISASFLYDEEEEFLIDIILHNLYESAKIHENSFTISLKNKISERQIQELKRLNISFSWKGAEFINSPICQGRSVRVGSVFEFSFDPLEDHSNKINS